MSALTRFAARFGTALLKKSHVLPAISHFNVNPIIKMNNYYASNHGNFSLYFCYDQFDENDRESAYIPYYVIAPIAMGLVNHNDDDDNDDDVDDKKEEESKQKPHTEFNNKFKVILFSKIQENGISDDITSSKINPVLDTIIWDLFHTQFPQYIENKEQKKFKPTRLRYLRRKVRKFYVAENRKTTQTNYLSVGDKGFRSSGSGPKAIIPAGTAFSFWKAFNSKCLSVGSKYTSFDLGNFIVDMIKSTKQYHVKNDAAENKNKLPVVDVNEYFIGRFKKQWNLQRSKYGNKSFYDLDVIMPKHCITLCKIWALRLIFPSKINYVGHHDQVCLFYGGDNRYMFTTHVATSNSGAVKTQQSNKTFTSIPTIYDYFKMNKIEMGTLINILESSCKAGGFSDSYKKDLKKAGLRPKFNANKTGYNDVSYNAWQQFENMQENNGGIWYKEESIKKL